MGLRLTRAAEMAGFRPHWRTAATAAMLAIVVALQACADSAEPTPSPTEAPTTTAVPQQTATLPTTPTPTPVPATPTATPAVTVSATPVPPTVAPSPASDAMPGVDWPTYGFDIAHTGANPYETQLGVENVGGLHEVWSIDLGGWLTSQPVFAAGIDVPGRGQTDILYVGNELGELFALDVQDPLPDGQARIAWSKQLGPGVCDTGINGVTGTPTIDRATNRIYAVSGDNRLYALDLTTGADVAGWPVALTDNIDLEHVYSGLTLNDGILYVATAGACGDERTAPYHARVVAVDAASAEIRAVWFPAEEDGPYGGGIWSPAAVSIGEDGDVYAAVGNANAEPETYGYSEHIVRLDALLTPKASHLPELSGFDVDFSSAPVLFQPPGCKPLLMAMAKTGDLFVYEQDAIDAGPAQRLQIAAGVGFFLGMPVYSADLNMVYVGNAADSEEFLHGLVALKVGSDCALTSAWQQPVGANPSVTGVPTVANGVVYFTTGMGNQMFAFDALTGEKLWDSGDLIKGRTAAAPVVVNGRVYIGAWDNKLYALGP